MYRPRERKCALYSINIDANMSRLFICQKSVNSEKLWGQKWYRKSSYLFAPQKWPKVEIELKWKQTIKYPRNCCRASEMPPSGEYRAHISKTKINNHVRYFSILTPWCVSESSIYFWKDDRNQFLPRNK